MPSTDKMLSLKITDARGKLLQVDTGANRRLLYLAAGADVGCSLGLFWHKCDSFYLIDPEYGNSIKYDNIINQLKTGTDAYMHGFKVEASTFEKGFWARESALPGRRYQVYWEREPSQKKRLCFVSSGSLAWLKSTNTKYNVIINKDYAGFDGAEYPYEAAWDRLNKRGIFCEDIAPSRSSEKHGFASYVYRGFQPLFKVVDDTERNIGFYTTIHLFQKTISGNFAFYQQKKKDIESISKLIDKKLEVFATSFEPSAITDEPEYKDLPEYKELYELMICAPTKNWAAFSVAPPFIKWLTTQLGGLPLETNLLCELMEHLRMDTWGPW